MVTHLDVILVFISGVAFVITAINMMKAERKERLKFITPLLWFLSDFAFSLYCLHCPFRAEHVRQSWKNIWSGANKIIGVISYFAALSSAERIEGIEKIEKAIGGGK